MGLERKQTFHAEGVFPMRVLSYIGNVLRIGVASVFGGHRPLLGHLWEQTDVVSLYGNTLCDFGLSQMKDVKETW